MSFTLENSLMSIFESYIEVELSGKVIIKMWK